MHRDLNQQQEADARRAVAEALFAEETLAPVEHLSPEAVRRLVHELRVHQIQLEMQNEELRGTEAELGLARARYFDLYDCAPVGYLVLDAQGRILEANLTMATLLGLERGLLARQPITRFILKEDQILYARQRKAPTQARPARAFDLRMKRVDDSSFWAHLSSAQVDGGLTRLVVSDISLLKETELLLTRRLDELNEAQKLAHIAGWEWNALTGTLWWSPELYRIFALDPTTSLDRARHAELYTRESAARLEAMVERALATGQPYDLELELATPLDDPRWVRTRGEVRRDAKACIVGLRGTAMDITERMLAGQEEARLQSRLLQASKMDSLGSLAGGIAHDMNNVLGAILALATANLQLIPPGGPFYRAFDIIAQAAARGGTMVKSLLSFARTRPREERDLDLNQVLRDQVVLLERTTLSRVVLDLDLAPALEPIRGDATALGNTFMNLCINAVDAMPGKGRLQVQTRNAEPGWVEVLLRDTGKGMTAEVLAKAMDPFFTTKGEGQGTGLGLSMAYSTIRAHGGEFELESLPGIGTTVRMRFPALLPASAAPPCEPGEDGPGSPLSLPRRLLLIDDDDLVRLSLKTTLELLGHQVAVASTGEDGLKRLAFGPRPDLVILDMNMPGLGGAATLPLLRGLCPDLPILLATGKADLAALELVRLNRCVALLLKPFTSEALQRSLQALCAESDPNHEVTS